MTEDMLRRLEKLRDDAGECKLISDRAADKATRDLFAKLSDQLTHLSWEVQRALAKLENGD